MHHGLRIATVLLPSLTWGSVSAAPPAALSAATVAALVPGAASGKLCGGSYPFDAGLTARLRLARSLAQAQELGSGPIGLYSGIGKSDLPIGDVEPTARRYFDQGLAFAYGFNHLAAIRSFRRAREIDAQCAACWWGEALASGPNINAAMNGTQNATALASLAAARRLSTGANPFVRALIEAQAARFSVDPKADRAKLDQDYARAMMALARGNPQSDDLAVLAAEAAMNTSPWNYWTSGGQPAPLIAEAVDLVEAVMRRNPTHPQAAHLYIHLLELPDPRKAEAAADRLRDSGPKALGHLVHMPSHVYYRLGRYADSMQANIAAVAADEAYLREAGDDGMVRFGYYPHNVHFLLTSAQMMGDPATVVNQTAKLETILDTETGRELYWVQAIYAAPFFAYAQYASPEAILARTAKPHPLEFVEAMRHYARAVAHAADRRGTLFEAELAALNQLAASSTAATMEAGGFPARALIRLAAEVAQGRRAMAQSRAADAIAHFSKAVEMQRAIPYNEPPLWYYPVAQSLGAAFFEAGRFREAREAFRAALSDAPNSALALYGLARTERKLNHGLEARAAEQAFRSVWKGDGDWLDMSRI